MSQIEVAVTLMAIIYGLMLTELFSGFNRLLRSRNKVKWHWLPILSSWFIFIVLIKNYWLLANDSARWDNFISFFIYGHIFVLIYLLVSSVFPSIIPEEGIDLKAYYFKNHRYFWGLMSGVLLSSIVTKMILGIINGNEISLLSVLIPAIFVFMTLCLSIWKNYRLHSIFIVFFVFGQLIEVIFLVIT